MKLVELLAKELSVWPESAYAYAQDADTRAFPWTGTPEFDGGDWIIASGSTIDSGSSKVLYFQLASDYKDAVVTKEQWQAERDRQKGGVWKRHRGGKCPVPVGTKVSTRHRDGEVVDVHFHTATTGSGPATMNTIWKHTGDDHDIMAYKIISQPQAEEPTVNVFTGKDSSVEYAFGEPGCNMSDLDWKPLGNAKAGDIEFDSVKAEEVEVKGTTIGTLSLKVEVDTSDATQAIDELAAKWDQIETPFKWRDEVTELNAYIEKFTRERDALIERLASEGFALIPPVVSVVSEFSGVDIGDWRHGDVISCNEDYPHQFTKGFEYIVDSLSKSEGRVSVVSDDNGEHNGWGAGHFKFIRRP